MQEIKLINLILRHLNTKPIGECHYLADISNATNLDRNTVEVICQEIDKLGGCSYHQHCTSITQEGKYKADNGGYTKGDISTAAFIDNSVKAKGNIEGSVITGGIKDTEIKHSFKKNEEIPGTQAITKEGLRISKKTLTWTIIGILSAILLGLLAGYKQGWFAK